MRGRRAARGAEEFATHGWVTRKTACEMLELLTNPDAWIALATLTLLEIELLLLNIRFRAKQEPA